MAVYKAFLSRYTWAALDSSFLWLCTVYCLQKYSSENKPSYSFPNRRSCLHCFFSSIWPHHCHQPLYMQRIFTQETCWRIINSCKATWKFYALPFSQLFWNHMWVVFDLLAYIPSALTWLWTNVCWTRTENQPRIEEPGEWFDFSIHFNTKTNQDKDHHCGWNRGSGTTSLNLVSSCFNVNTLKAKTLNSMEKNKTKLAR